MAELEPFADVIVVLPGIMGSTLKLDDDIVWGPSGGALLRAVRTLGRNLKDLTVPQDARDGPDPRVEAVAVMPDLHVLPGIWTVNLGYTTLLSWLRRTFALVPAHDGGPPGNLLEFPYDWRLSNRYNGEQLEARVTPVLDRWRNQGGRFTHARVVLIGHSMGGLIARWYLQRCGGAEVVSKLITLGTPYRGSLKALDQLANGVRKGPWPFRVNLSAFARSMPSAYQLLPEYSCIETDGGLKKITDTTLPQAVDPELAKDAMLFHSQLDSSPVAGYSTYLLTGRRQRTATTATVAGNVLTPVDTIEGVNEAGDGTVPTVGSVPYGMTPDDPSLFFVAEHHGALQSNHGVFDQIEGILTARTVAHKGYEDVTVDVAVPDVLDLGEDLVVRAQAIGDWAPLDAIVTDESGVTVDRQRLSAADGELRTTFSGLAPGGYTVVVRGAGTAVARVQEVTSSVVIWDEAP